MRLIDADNLKEAVKTNLTSGEYYPYHFIKLIDNAQTVEEKSYAMGYQDGLEDGLQDMRPQGKWIWRETGTSICRYGYFTCSNCSFVSKAKQNFCAECGADMRKGGAE